MQDVAQLINKQFFERLRFVWIGTFRVDGGRISLSSVEVLKRRGFNENPRLTLVPRSSSVYLAVISFACRIVEELVDELGCGGNFANAKRRLAHTLQRKGECAHMSDLSCHEKLERILGAGVATEINETLIDDFCARLCGNIAAQIDVELAGDLEVISGPSVPNGVIEVDSATASDRDKGIDLGLFSNRFQRLEMQTCQRPDDFQVAQLFGADVHQEVLTTWIVAI